jgi:hypothetical protein
VKEDNAQLNYNVSGKVQTLNEFVEAWHVKIWDHAFGPMFRDADSYSKTKAFQDNKNIDLVKRVISRQANCLLLNHLCSICNAHIIFKHT